MSGKAADLQLTEIRAGRGWFDLNLGAVWRHRDLLANLVIRDLKVLYRQAAIGAAWAILQPVFTVAIFSIVFGAFARLPSEGVPYPIFAFAGVLPWLYFAEAVRRSSLSMVSDAELIRKVYFPRIIMPAASVTAPLVDLAIGLVVMLVVAAFYGVAPTWRLIALPALVLATTGLALSVGLWLGPLNVRFRDVKHTLPFLIQVWMYASPIIYPLSMIPEQYRGLYSLNPMVGIIEGFRWALLGHGHLNLVALSISAATIVVLLLGGVVFFRRMERTFADTI